MSYLTLRRLRAGFWCLALLLSSSIFAQVTVQSKTLGNGLTIYVKEDHRAPVLISEVWYKVGSSYESMGNTGISHLLEHMMFDGTPTYGPGVFSRSIAENGGQENAFTYDDFTAYYQELAADKLPMAFQLESDRMRHLSLTPEEFNKEIKVVREERRWRVDNNPLAKMGEQFFSQAYVALPYHNPTVGWPADLYNITVEDLRAWYQRWYAPNNAFIVVVGDVKADDVFALAEKYFGALKPMTLPSAKPQLELSNPGQRRLNLKIPAEVPVLMMGYSAPTIMSDKNSIDPYALDVLGSILAGSDSARLQQNLVRHQALASSIDINYELYKRFSSVWVIEAVPQKNVDINTLEKAIRSQIQTLQQKPVSSEELEKVKKNAIANAIYQQDDISNLAQAIGTLTATGSDWSELNHYVTQIQKVSAADVQRVAQQYLVGNQEIVGILTPLPSKANTVETPNPGESYVH